jgi:hypothetical protein
MTIPFATMSVAKAVTYFTHLVIHQTDWYQRWKEKRAERRARDDDD